MAKFKQIANDLINSEWFDATGRSSHDSITVSNDARLTMCLLIDIAESLRVLRCINFKMIPNKLDVIIRNTKRRRKKKI